MGLAQVLALISTGLVPSLDPEASNKVGQASPHQSSASARSESSIQGFQEAGLNIMMFLLSLLLVPTGTSCEADF